MACILSSHSIRDHVKYDPIVRALLDDEDVEWNRSCLLSSGVDH